jgi:hypothetical protein
MDSNDPTNGMLDKINIEKILQSDDVSKLNLELDSFAGSAEDASEKLEQFTKLMEKAFEKDLEDSLNDLKKAKLNADKLAKVNKKVRNSLDKFSTDVSDVLLKKIKKMTGGDKLTDNITSALANMTKGMNAKFRPMEAMSSAPSGSSSGSSKAERRKHRLAEEEGKAYGASLLNGVSHFASTIATMLLGGTDLYSELIKGFPDAALLYRREMKKNLFLTEGLTNETSLLIDKFDTLSDTVEITGFGLKESQKAMTMMVSRGYKNAKIMKQIATSSLNTANMMGLSASESLVMTEMFSDWNQHFGLSVHQLGSIGVGMRDISRTSGLTGQNLLAAVKSSEQFLEIMRKSGQLTSSSARNLASISASLQKNGVMSDANSIMGHLASPTKILTGQSGTEGSLMAGAAGRAGLTSKFFSGTILKSKKDTASFFGAFEKELSGIFGVDFKNLDKLDPQMKAILNASLEDQGLQTLDTYKRIFDGVREASEPLSKALSTYDSETMRLSETLKKATGEEKALIEQELLSIKQKKSGASISAAASATHDILDIVTKSGANYKADIGLKATGGQISNAIEDLHDLMMNSGQKDLADQVKGGKQDAILKAAAMSSSKALKDLGGADMTAELLKVIDSQDSLAIQKGFQEVTDRINIMNKNQKLENTSPMDKLMSSINRLNTSLVEYVSKPLNKFMDIIGEGGLASIYLGLMAVSLGLAALGTILTTAVVAKGTGGLLNWLFPNFTKSVGGLKGMFGNIKKRMSMADSGVQGFFVRLRQGLWGTAKKGIIDKIFDFLFQDIDAPIAKVKTQWDKLGTGLKNLPKNAGTQLSRLGVAISKMPKEIMLTLSNLRKLDVRAVIGSFGSAIGSGLTSIGQKLSNFGSMLSTKWVNMLAYMNIDATGSMTRLRTSLSTGWTKIGNIWSNGLDAIMHPLRSFSRIGELVLHPIETAKKGFGLIKAGYQQGFKGILGVARISNKGLLATYKAFSGTMKASTAGLISPLFAGIDGAIGAFTGFVSAGKNFEEVLKASGKSMNDVTTSMKISSTIGGALWGVIDGIFLGLPGLVLYLLGLSGAVEKFFTFVVHTFTVFFEGMWEGIKTGIADVMPAITSVWEHVKTQVSKIGESLLRIWNKVTSIFGGTEAVKIEDVFMTIWEVVKPIGAFLGKLIGWATGATFVAFLGVLSVIVTVIESVVYAIEMFSTAIYGAGILIRGVAKIFGIIPMALFSIGEQLYNLFAGKTTIYGAITAFSATMIDWIGGIFPDVLNGLGYLVTGFVATIGKFFATLLNPFTFGLTDLIYDGFKVMYKMAAKLSKSIGTWLGPLVVKELNYLGEKMKDVVSSIPGKISGGLSQIGKIFVDSVMSIPKMMMSGLSSIGSAIYDSSPEWLKVIFNGIAAIGKMFNDNIIKPMTDFGLWIKGKWDEWIFKPLGTLAGFLGNTVYTTIEKSIKVNVIDPLMLIGVMFNKVLDAFNLLADKLSDTKTASSLIDSSKKTTEAVIKSGENELIKKLNETSVLKDNGLKQAKLQEAVDSLGQKLRVQKAHTEQVKKDYSNSGLGYVNALNPIATGYAAYGLTKQAFGYKGNATQENMKAMQGTVKLNEGATAALEQQYNVAVQELEKSKLNNKVDSKNIQDTTFSIEKLTKEATEKHSIYTHDTHVEKLLGANAKPLKVTEQNNSETHPMMANDVVEKVVKRSFAKAADSMLVNVPSAKNENGLMVKQGKIAQGELVGSNNAVEKVVKQVDKKTTKQRLMNKFVEEHGKEARYETGFAKATGKLKKDSERYATNSMLEHVPRIKADNGAVIKQGRIVNGELASDSNNTLMPSMPSIPSRKNAIIQQANSKGPVTEQVLPKKRKEFMSQMHVMDAQKYGEYGAYKKEFADDPVVGATMKALEMTDMNEDKWRTIPNQADDFQQSYMSNKNSLEKAIMADPIKAKEEGGASAQLSKLNANKENWDSMMTFYNKQNTFKEYNPAKDMIMKNLKDSKGYIPGPDALPLLNTPAFTQPQKYKAPSAMKNILPEEAMIQPSTKLITPPSTIPEARFLSDTLISANEEKAKLTTAKTAISTMPETDAFEQSLRQRNEKTTSEPAGARMDSRELLNVNEQQVIELEEIKEYMSELVQIFSSRSSGGSGTKKQSTKSNSNPTSSPDFFRWQYGSISQNPNKDIITTGV